MHDGTCTLLRRGECYDINVDFTYQPMCGKMTETVLSYTL